MMKRKTVFMAAALSLLICASSSLAGLVNVNMTYSGERPTGAAGTGIAGDYWNNYGFMSVPYTYVLKDADENDSGISMINSERYGWHAGTINETVGPLLYGYYGNSSNNTDGLSTTFSGFSEGDIVDVYCYSAAVGQAGGGQTFTIDGTSLRGTNKGLVSSFVEGENYVVFYGVTPDANGEITVVGSYDHHPINGYQLDITPEPASIGLLGVGGLFAVLRRKK